MTAAEQRAAVEALPPMLVAQDSSDKKYDLRAIALWILDHPREADYRLSDWWNAPLRENAPAAFAAFNGRPISFLSHDIELAAYRLIQRASIGEVYAPGDLRLALRGGAPVEGPEVTA